MNLYNFMIFDRLFFEKLLQIFISHSGGFGVENLITFDLPKTNLSDEDYKTQLDKRGNNCHLQ